MCKISDSNAGPPCVAVFHSVRRVSSAGRNTSGKMVAWQQNWFHLGGAGELHTGCDQLGGGGELHMGCNQLGGAGVLYLDLEQLGGVGSFGIVILHYKKQSKFPFNLKKMVHLSAPI